MKLLKVIFKWTPQPENLRHLAACIFWLGQRIRKGLLWLMHKNWIDTLRPRWQAASLNDYARSSYKAITRSLYPDLKWPGNLPRVDIICKDTHARTHARERVLMYHMNLHVYHASRLFQALNCFVEIMCWFHSEISDCGHDVRGGRQSNRRSGYHLQVEMGTETHLCELKWTWRADHWHRWALIMTMCWVSVCWTCSLPRSILSISWSPLWRSSSRFNSSWAILSYKTQAVTSVQSVSDANWICFL